MLSLPSQHLDLVTAVGESDISLLAVVTAMIGSETAWEGAVSFFKEVLLAKEPVDMGKSVAQSIRHRPKIVMACPTRATRSRVRLF